MFGRLRSGLPNLRRPAWTAVQEAKAKQIVASWSAPAKTGGVSKLAPMQPRRNPEGTNRDWVAHQPTPAIAARPGFRDTSRIPDRREPVNNAKSQYTNSGMESGGTEEVGWFTGGVAVLVLGSLAAVLFMQAKKPKKKLEFGNWKPKSMLLTR